MKTGQFLSLSQIQERLAAPSKSRQINEALHHEERVRFHTEAQMRGLHKRAASDFLNWVETLIPKDKFNNFRNLFRQPVPTIPFVTEMYKELERVFDGRNATSTYAFNIAKYRDDWEWYRPNKLGYPHVWRAKGWQKVKSSINSLVVIDVPSVQTTALPEPYFYFLPFCHVIDYEMNENEMLEDDVFDWVMFRTEEDRIAVFDTKTIRIFRTKPDRPNEIEALESESVHTLDFCPVTFLWSDSITANCPEVKSSPITKELSNLDWYLFHLISKRALDLYASYPIYSGYSSECEYEDEASDARCDGGYLRGYSNNTYHFDGNGGVAKCPLCASRNLAGAGSYIEIPVPDGESIPDMRSPITITTIDVASLNYNVSESERLKGEIFSSVTGIGGGTGIVNKASITASQVAANYDSKTSVINALKANFERVQKFVDTTICKIRYGSAFLECSIDLGNEFYLKTAEDLYAKYATAKANGASEAELEAINTQILNVEHRNNPLQLQRMLILQQLEPYRHLSISEVTGLYGQGLADEDLVLLKIAFNEYVQRFERENLNIIEFGVSLDFSTKIDTIKQELLKYVNDSRPKRDASNRGGQANSGSDQTNGNQNSNA